jgi:hypothetical protein
MVLNEGTAADKTDDSTASSWPAMTMAHFVGSLMCDTAGMHWAASTYSKNIM